MFKSGVEATKIGMIKRFLKKMSSKEFVFYKKHQNLMKNKNNIN